MGNAKLGVKDWQFRMMTLTSQEAVSLMLSWPVSHLSYLQRPWAGKDYLFYRWVSEAGRDCMCPHPGADPGFVPLLFPLSYTKLLLACCRLLRELFSKIPTWHGTECGPWGCGDSGQPEAIGPSSSLKVAWATSRQPQAGQDFQIGLVELCDKSHDITHRAPLLALAGGRHGPFPKGICISHYCFQTYNLTTRLAHSL